MRRSDDETAPYPVAISPDLVNRLETCIEELNLQPVRLNPQSGSNEVNLLVSPFETPISIKAHH